MRTANEAPIDIADSASLVNFVKSSELAVMLISAQWDPQSRKMPAAMTAAGSQLGAVVQFGIVDIDNSGLWLILGRLGVMTTPTVIVYREGELVLKRHGMQSSQQLILLVQAARARAQHYRQTVALATRAEGAPFDWASAAALPEYAPLVGVCARPLHVADDTSEAVGPCRQGRQVYDLESHSWVRPRVGLYRIGAEAYAVAGNRRFGGYTQGGPFVYLLLWAASDGAALRAAFQREDSDEGLWSMAPADLLPDGGDARYGNLLRKLQSIEPAPVQRYDFNTDGFCVGRTAAARFQYHFRSGRDDPLEPAYAIALDKRR